MERRIQQRKKRREPIKYALKDGLPGQLHPIVDRIVEKDRFTLKTLRILSAFFDDLSPTPVCSPEKIMRWKRDTIDFFYFVEQQWSGSQVRTGVLVYRLKEYAEEVANTQVGNTDLEYKFQLLLLAATIESSIVHKNSRDAFGSENPL